MAKEKCKCPEGVPDWVVTYGDMMSLLLCFFILLAAFSEPKKDREFQEVIQAIREAFGNSGGSGYSPSKASPKNSIMSRLNALNLKDKQFKERSNADDPGVDGKEKTVTAVREGTRFAVGGPVPFDRGSTQLTPETMRQLDRIVDEVRGKNNKVEIRGHTSRDDLPANSADAAYWDLSHERARAVKRYLTDPRRGIRPERLRLVACGPYEPIVTQDPLEQVNNRRVEVLQMEALVQDLSDEKTASIDEPTVQPDQALTTVPDSTE